MPKKNGIPGKGKREVIAAQPQKKSQKFNFDEFFGSRKPIHEFNELDLEEFLERGFSFLKEHDFIEKTSKGIMITAKGQQALNWLLIMQKVKGGTLHEVFTGNLLELVIYLKPKFGKNSIHELNKRLSAAKELAEKNPSEKNKQEVAALSRTIELAEILPEKTARPEFFSPVAVVSPEASIGREIVLLKEKAGKKFSKETLMKALSNKGQSYLNFFRKNKAAEAFRFFLFNAVAKDLSHIAFLQKPRNDRLSSLGIEANKILLGKKKSIQEKNFFIDGLMNREIELPFFFNKKYEKFVEAFADYFFKRNEVGIALEPLYDDILEMLGG